MADLISREAAIECAINAVDDWDGGWNPNRETVIRKYFEEVPAVDAVPVVHAQPVWINPLNPGAKMCTWKCSSLCSACGDYVATSWKYCPNCGARMDGEENATD